MIKCCALFGLLILLLTPSGCDQSDGAEPTINLSDLEPVAPAGYAEENVLPLRVAVAAVASPKGNLDSYRPLLDYLGEQLERPVEMIQRRTYAEVNELIRDGQVDLAFVCTSAYVAGQREFGMELLAAPQVNGEAVYYSYLIVPADSPAHSMADLKGKVFAFTDPMSHTGRNYPTWLVQQLSEQPETFFERTFFTYSHDDAIHAVADGLADGAAVDSLVYDFALARDPALAGRVRIIHQSMPFGAPPVVVGPQVRPQLRAELYDLLVSLERSAEGRAILQTLGIQRFVAVDDHIYDSVRQIERDVREPPLALPARTSESNEVKP